MFVVPQEPGDAEMLAERIAPRLQHANSAVVLTAVKVIVYLMNYMSKDEDISNMCKKLSPPLGTCHIAGFCNGIGARSITTNIHRRLTLFSFLPCSDAAVQWT